ncbi:MAG: hypothetical protein NXI16_13375 [Alphaproteobacteria bacterium]|nr:hypothetical protein [Alphaproteobacteria bacterium]
MSQISEKHIIEGLLPELEAEGYEVYANPRGPIIPRFLGGYVPDLIALRPDGNLIYEIKMRQSKAAGETITQIKKLVDAEPNWSLRVVYANPKVVPKTLKKPSRSNVEHQLEVVRALTSGGNVNAALLLGWATFEAAARHISPDDFATPQTTDRLIGRLASEGHVMPQDAETIKRIGSIRNAVAHGVFGEEVRVEDVEELCRIVSSVLDSDDMTADA